MVFSVLFFVSSVAHVLIVANILAVICKDIDDIIRWNTSVLDD